MANFFRLLIGIVLLPACWAFARSLFEAVCVSAGAEGAFSVETLSLLGGIAAFSLCWMALAHPVKAYVLGHELTHAIWGILFGAKPSALKVGEKGGSVNLSKSNMLITLAPYFFPFYTFVVIIAALVTFAFLRPLPFLPLWMFLIGFTWAFHVLFTLETLALRQPDVKLYGRVFSWTFIFIVNVAIVLAWLAATGDLSFGELYGIISKRLVSVYVGVYDAAVWAVSFFAG